VTEPLPITSLKALRAAEEKCTRCPLYKHATQVVPGEGPARARIMMVGEQPGDQEDKQGRPFVGPAGGVLAKALADAGIERKVVFVTNAVNTSNLNREASAVCISDPTSTKSIDVTGGSISNG
jgi:uracil-DNA glycosylase